MALPKYFKFSPEVLAAKKAGVPIVALESTVITHGLPHSPSLRGVPTEWADEAISTTADKLPMNLQLARDLESIVRSNGAVPATIAVLAGRVCVGMDPDELQRLAAADNPRKLSSRDLAAAVSDKVSGGTTVAGTLRVAALAGIRAFATGGIGGVHPGDGWDVSADLGELAKQPVLLVCAGAKAVLDLPATLEQFETLGVPVIGYATDEFPAFYSVSSGLPTSGRADTPEQAAALARIHWELGGGGVLLAAPPPVESALPRAEVQGWIDQALAEVAQQGLRGQAVTPYLLSRVSQLSGGRSLQANLALLKNNAKLAAQVAQFLGEKRSKSI